VSFFVSMQMIFVSSKVFNEFDGFGWNSLGQGKQLLLSESEPLT
jgi:hypothetical protein